MKTTQTVLITGAEGALGSVVAARFLAAGASVYATHHPKQKAPTSPAGLEWVAADLTDSASVKALVDDIGRKRPIDALVHCAGGFRFGLIDQLSDADLDFLLNINLKATFLLVREVVAGMKKTGFGRIVLVSARASLQPTAGIAAYAASKAGINALVSAVADEVKSADININAVLPTMIDTPANRTSMPGSDFSAWVKREDLAEIIFSLAQPLGKPIQGALIPVSGRL